jgi:hypothetical protein
MSPLRLIRLMRIGPRAMRLSLWVPAALLQTAVRMTNSVVEGSDHPEIGTYGAPAYARSVQPRTCPGTKVPVPHINRAMIIMFAVCVMYFAVLGLTVVAISMSIKGNLFPGVHYRSIRLADRNSLSVIALAIGFAVNTAMVAALLPTSIGRALVVVTFKWAMASVIILALVAFNHVRKTPGLLPQRGRAHTSLKTQDVAIRTINS